MPNKKSPFAFMTVILMFVLLALSLPPVKAADALEPNAEKQFFRPFEFQIGTFYQTATPDFEAETGSAGIETAVFFTRNFGIGASTDLNDMNGHFIDNVSLRGIYRVPIERTAIYGYGGALRYLESEEWAISLGVGVEHRFAPNFGPFVEAGMIKFLKHAAVATGRVGLRISF